RIIIDRYFRLDPLGDRHLVSIARHSRRLPHRALAAAGGVGDRRRRLLSGGSDGGAAAALPGRARPARATDDGAGAAVERRAADQRRDRRRDRRAIDPVADLVRRSGGGAYALARGAGGRRACRAQAGRDGVRLGALLLGVLGVRAAPRLRAVRTALRREPV